MARCAGYKPDGSPCERIVSASQRYYCFAHDPATAAQRSRNASKAARSKPLRELRAVKERLRTLAEGVLTGEVDQDAAAVASRILGVYLRAVEQERKLKEQEEILERIEALERRAKQGGHRRWP
jgi:flagellar motility protein MotE (MotC chaperone)